MRIFTTLSLCVCALLLSACCGSAEKRRSGTVDIDMDQRPNIAIAVSEISSMWRAVQAYKVKNRQWPSEGIQDIAKMTDSKINAKDPWGWPYDFKRTESGYEIRSYGPDEGRRTADDIYINSSEGLVNGSSKKASSNKVTLTKEDQAGSDLERYWHAVMFYRTKNKKMPEDSDTVFKAWIFGKDPIANMDPWGSAYVYQKTTYGSYEVRSAGPDKRMGTGDDLYTSGNGNISRGR